MTAICLVNRKGGVGKTTVTLALADFLSTLHGRRVLIVDMDPQANASLALLGQDRWFELETAGKTVADLFRVAQENRGQLPPRVGKSLVVEGIRRIKGSLQPLSVIPCTPRLQETEERMMEVDPEWRYFIGSPYFILSQALVKEVFPSYDYVLIDCPPALGVATLNALTSANGYLIPTIPDHVSTIGIQQVIDRVAQHGSSLRRVIKLYGTVINRFKTTTRLHHTVLAELRSKRELQPVWDTILPDTVKAEEGYLLDEEMTLKGRYGGENHNHYQALIQLAEEFVRRIP